MKEEYSKRTTLIHKLLVVTGKHILENKDKLTKYFNTNIVLFNTKDNDFCQIIDINEIYKENSLLRQAIELHQNDYFIITKPTYYQENYLYANYLKKGSFSNDLHNLCLTNCVNSDYFMLHTNTFKPVFTEYEDMEPTQNIDDKRNRKAFKRALIR